jgi:hypothetical protein
MNEYTKKDEEKTKRKIFYNLYKLDSKRIGFEPIDTPFPNPTGLRIKLYYLNKKTKKDLIIAPRGSEFFSFGVQEDAFSKNQNSTNYNMPLFINLENKKIKDFCDSFDFIYERCVNYLFENKKELGIRVDNKESLKRIFKYPLFKVPEVPKNKKSKYEQFRLYPKLIIKHENSTISKVWTEFFEKTEDGNLVQCDFESLINTRVHAYVSILVDSVYIVRPNTPHTQISLQCKLSEAIIKRIKKENKPSLKDFNSDDDQETGDDEDSDNNSHETDDDKNNGKQIEKLRLTD